MALERRWVPSGDTRSPVIVSLWPFSVIDTSTLRRSHTCFACMQRLIRQYASGLGMSTRSMHAQVSPPAITQAKACSFNSAERSA